MENGYEKILFQSLEVVLSAEDKNLLLSYFDENTLVLGPVLEGHDFHEGLNPLRGRTSPWNTCAIWNTRKLAIVGFPLIGDGVPNEIPGGVEVEFVPQATSSSVLSRRSLLLLSLKISIPHGKRSLSRLSDQVEV